MRILIVDDEPHIRRMMRLTLEGAPAMRWRKRPTARQALACSATAAGSTATLLDQKMPGLDGLETLRRIKQRAPDACVVMVTAYASIELAVDAMQLGATDFLRKPMTPETLRRAVAAALARSSAPADAGVSAEAAVAPPSDRPTTMPPIEIWTTNGFFVRRLGVTEEAGGLSHRFLVRQGRGESGVEIDVLIPARTRADTARQAGCQPSAEFWRGQAESAAPQSPVGQRCRAGRTPRRRSGHRGARPRGYGCVAGVTASGSRIDRSSHAFSSAAPLAVLSNMHQASTSAGTARMAAASRRECRFVVT